MEPLEPLGHPEASRKQMRALAHPVRMRILELLAQGPSTATRLAGEIGESTGSTSYHLRALAKAELTTESDEMALWYEAQRRQVWSAFLDNAMKSLGQKLETPEERAEEEAAANGGPEASVEAGGDSVEAA